MSEAVCETTFEARAENLPAIMDFIIDAMKNMGVGEEDSFKVQLAVDEAATNIINYAYDGHAGPIWIRCTLKGDDVYVVLMDTGAAFDPTGSPEPDVTSGIEDRKVGGLGIYFIREMMDAVRYERSGGKNTLILVKHLSRGSK